MSKIKPQIFLRNFTHFLYDKLVKINDTPQRVASGFGVGVFSGIFPGMGPLAALFIASLFKANRASALIASLLTNTWISLVTFVMSVKVGAYIMGIDWQTAKDQWSKLFKNFHFADLFKVSLLKTIFPIMIGYLVMAVFLGVLSYLVILLFFYLRRRLSKRPNQI